LKLLLLYLMHKVSSGLQKVGIDIIGTIQEIDNLLVVLRHWRKEVLRVIRQSEENS